MISNILLDEWKYKNKLFKLIRSDITRIKFPKLVVLQTYNRCNCCCSMCPYSYTVAKENKSLMSLKAFRRILQELKEHKEFETMILAFQNEPLLDPRIISFVEEFKQSLPNKKIELVTNGSLLTPEITQKIYSLIDTVHVSLNAHTEKTHQIVSNSLHFKQIINNLNNISKNKEWREKTLIRFIKQRANFHEHKLFKECWNSKGFKVFGFDANDRLKDVKNFDKAIKMPNSYLRKIKMKLLKLFGKMLLPTCPIPFLCTYIKANGDIVQCFNDWSNQNILGNVNQQSIFKIFNSLKYKQIRQLLLEDKLDKNVICSKCDLYKEGVWLTA